MKKSELKQIIKEELENLSQSFQVSNENSNEFEQFLGEFNLTQNVINIKESDFYTTYKFIDLTSEEVSYIENEISNYDSYRYNLKENKLKPSKENVQEFIYDILKLGSKKNLFDTFLKRKKLNPDELSTFVKMVADELKNW